MYGNWFQSLKFRPKRCSPTHLPTRSTWVRLGLKKSNAPSPLFHPRPGVRMTLAVPHTHKRRKRDEDDYVLLIVFMHKQKIPAVSDCRVVREGWSRCRCSVTYFHFSQSRWRWEYNSQAGNRKFFFWKPLQSTPAFFTVLWRSDPVLPACQWTSPVYCLTCVRHWRRRLSEPLSWKQSSISLPPFLHIILSTKHYCPFPA